MAVPVRRDWTERAEVPEIPVAPRPYAARFANITLSALRIVAGLMFMQHGIQKHFGLLIPAGQPYAGPPSPLSQLWIAGVLEIGGGLLVALGLLTRPVALILAGEMAFAYFIAHASRALYPIMNGGELAVLYCFVFLALSGTGGGNFSIDGLIKRGRRVRQPATA